jgi:hypothetical protein
MWRGSPIGKRPTLIRFDPVDRYVPLAGRSSSGPSGSPVNPWMTGAVQDALFGPPNTGTPEYAQWEAARQQRLRELGEER